ncbi:MAG: hypothetical protein IKE61_00475 [Coriobacteriales bacterium]|nr:hypothetical protein [Coriobacteriales bacterium]
MKRHLIKLSVIVIAAMLALVALAGCGQKQEAVDALRAASENLKAADSVEMNADITIKLKAEGIPLTISGNVDLAYAYDSDDLSKLLDSQLLYKMNMGLLGESVDMGVYYTDHKLYLSVATPDGTENVYYTLEGDTADLISTYLSENGEDLMAELDKLALPDVYKYFTNGRIEGNTYELEFDVMGYLSDTMGALAKLDESTDPSETAQAMQAIGSLVKGQKPRITFTLDSSGNFETFEFLWDMEIDGTAMGSSESIPFTIVYAVDEFKTGDVKFSWPDFSGYKNQGDFFEQFGNGDGGGLDFDDVDNLDDILPVAFRGGKAA